MRLTFALAASSVLTLASAASHNTGKVSTSSSEGEGTGKRTGGKDKAPCCCCCRCCHKARTYTRAYTTIPPTNSPSVACSS